MKRTKKIFSVLLMLVMVLTCGVFKENVSASTIGLKLTLPESGWTRFDDTNSKILYTGIWDVESNVAYYNSQRHSLIKSSAGTVTFSFYGSQLRLISSVYPGYSDKISVKIDNNPLEYFSESLGITDDNQILVYEKKDLTMGSHTVTLTKVDTGTYMGDFILDAIDIDSTGYLLDSNYVSTQSINIDKSSLNLNINDTTAVTASVYPTDATNKNVTWTSSDPTVATVDSTGKVTGLKAGIAIITATTVDGGKTATCNVNVNSNSNVPKLDIVASSHKINLGDEFTADAVAENVYGTYAEDFKVNYDTNLFQYEGFDEIPGYKVCNTPQDDNGVLRFIIASQGKDYVINGNQSIVKLKLKAKAIGTGKVDALKCRVADTVKEYDLDDLNCLEDTIQVQGDVNRTGDYTLLDLAIDGYYYNMNVLDTDIAKYDADQDINGKIDGADLIYVTNQILNNANYIPNNK